MTRRSEGTTVGVTAGSAFDLDVEREVFEGADVTLRPVDVETTDDLIAELAGVDAVIDRLLAAPYTREVVDSLDRCRIIARCGIGVDAIDTERAAERGMYVVNVPTYCQDEVSEHTIVLLLALERDLAAYDAAMKDGVWAQDVTSPAIHRLRGRTLGLVGFGRIARLVAEKARPFGMEVVASDPYVDAERWRAPTWRRPRSRRYSTSRAPDSTCSRRSRPGRGRGSRRSRTLRELDNVILTPHVAWFSREANEERRRTAARDVRRVLGGENPTNAVNEPRRVADGEDE